MSGMNIDGLLGLLAHSIYVVSEQLPENGLDRRSALDLYVNVDVRPQCPAWQGSGKFWTESG
jgi:hypothetical protein